MKMKTICKAALLAALGLAGVTAADAVTYTGDLLVGLTTQSGNDLVYDLGSDSSLVNGQTWDLTSALSAAGLSTSSSSLAWGVVGSKTVSGTKTVWLTDVITPEAIDNGEYANISADVSTLVNNDFTAVGAGNYATPAYGVAYSWYYETDQGANQSSVFSSDYTDPNLSGTGSIAFYSSTASGIVADLGSFSLSGSTLTFNAVPEPSTLSIMAGAGLLFLSLRNRLGRSGV